MGATFILDDFLNWIHELKGTVFYEQEFQAFYEVQFRWYQILPIFIPGGYLGN